MDPQRSITFKAFRATEEPELCQQFLLGHLRVLESVGVKKLSSAQDEWTQNPNCYVITAISGDGERVLGGSRVQIAGNGYPLPIEQAVGTKDPRIHDMVQRLTPQNVAELCGMWNSREVAGLGVGSVYVNRIGIAILTQIGVNYLLGLAASWTLEMGKKAGFQVNEGLGEKGTFYYPKEDFIATAIHIPDVVNLPTADAEERARIMELRENPVFERIETTRMGEVHIQYQLDLSVGNLVK